MAFTLYRVEADHVLQRADVVGQAWVCETAELAEALAADLRTRKDLENVTVRVRHYG